MDLSLINSFELIKPHKDLEEFHTDHIIPIYQGGMGVGIDNHQVVCNKCHLVKTAQERRTHGKKQGDIL